MNNVLSFTQDRPKLSLIERRQQLTAPTYAPRTLSPQHDAIPPLVAVILAGRYIGVYIGAGKWIGYDAHGLIYNIEIIETAPPCRQYPHGLYDYESMLAPSASFSGPDVA